MAQANTAVHHVVTTGASENATERYLRAADLPAVTGLSTATLWRLERRGEFPGRRRVSPRCVGWLASEVEEWLRSRPLARHAGTT